MKQFLRLSLILILGGVIVSCVHVRSSESPSTEIEAAVAAMEKERVFSIDLGIVYVGPTKAQKRVKAYGRAAEPALIQAIRNAEENPWLGANAAYCLREMNLQSAKPAAREVFDVLNEKRDVLSMDQRTAWHELFLFLEPRK